MINVYGIKNCDKCASLKKWLKKNEINFSFFDFDIHSIKKKKIKNWFENSLNKKDFFNKKSTTWKSLKLGDVNINDQELIELSFKNIRILKRPLIEFNNKTIYSGFKEDEILAIMKKL